MVLEENVRVSGVSPAAQRGALGPQRNGLIERTANDVLREMEEEDRQAWDAAEETGVWRATRTVRSSESSGSDRGTYIF